MLATISKTKLFALILSSSFIWAASSASALQDNHQTQSSNWQTGNQPQPPSQRYEPVRSAPPSVHVPDANARKLNAVTTQTNTAGTSFNFSDSPIAAQKIPTQSPQNNTGVRQVAYQQPVAQTPAMQPANSKIDPRVPLNLRGNSESPATYFRAAQQATEPQPKRTMRNTYPTQSTRKSTPLVNAQAFESQPYYDRSQTSQQAPQPHRVSGASPIQLAARPKPLAAKSNESSQIQQVAFTKQTDDDSTGISSSPLRGNNFSMRSENISSRGSELSTRADAGTTIQLSTPAMVVNTYGPTTVGLHKTATYKITCTNDSDRDVERILVGIDMPQWVDLQNINATGGQHEITDGNEQARLKWIVDRIPANTTHTITISAIPRKPEMFDLGVDWAFAPRKGMSHVTVTQPKLEMKISGPNDVLFGEKAIYHVTVSNPGTGTAEKVSVMLPEALGGERASLGDIPAGSEKNFQVELFARTSGNIDLAATAVADGQLETEVDRKILVRRANLTVAVAGPPIKYSGTTATYTVTVINQGDAAATEVAGALALPSGVKYLTGVNGAQQTESGLRWPIGTMNPGDKRTYQISCELNTSGNLQIEAGARGGGDVAASGAFVTAVETIADLVLSVDDPKGPLPTGELITYQIRVKNRGTKSANGVDLVMQFSDGIEPTQAVGLKHKVVPGQVLFSPIQRIDPGQEMVLKVQAKASKGGTHIFRAQLTCTDSDSREIAEGTTRFFGETTAEHTNIQTIESPLDANTADAENRVNAFDSNDFSR